MEVEKLQNENKALRAELTEAKAQLEKKTESKIASDNDNNNDSSHRTPSASFFSL